MDTIAGQDRTIGQEGRTGVWNGTIGQNIRTVDFDRTGWQLREGKLDRHKR